MVGAKDEGRNTGGNTEWNKLNLASIHGGQGGGDGKKSSAASIGGDAGSSRQHKTAGSGSRGVRFAAKLTQEKRL